MNTTMSMVNYLPGKRIRCDQVEDTPEANGLCGKVDHIDGIGIYVKLDNGKEVRLNTFSDKYFVLD